jgi:hypothetical protein
MAPSKADLLERAAAVGVEGVDESTSNRDIQAAIDEVLGTGTDAERACPNCGEFHASSLIPENEIDQLEGVKLSALPKSAVYRVFVCDGSFHVVPHSEGVES